MPPPRCFIWKHSFVSARLVDGTEFYSCLKELTANSSCSVRSFLSECSPVSPG